MYTLQNKKSSVKQCVSISGGISKEPPPFLMSEPIQCIRHKVSKKEWYGPSGKRTDLAKQCFMRSGSGRYLIVPVTKDDYPHLSIEIDDKHFQKKAEHFELSFTKMHYSPSKYGQRVFFEQKSPYGIFEVVSPYQAGLAEIIKRVKQWLAQAQINAEVSWPKLEKEAEQSAIDVSVSKDAINLFEALSLEDVSDKLDSQTQLEDLDIDN